jgi:hypothetical protein
MQLDRNLEELNEYRRKLDLSARDNKRLQDDLLTVTRENQVTKFFNDYFYETRKGVLKYKGSNLDPPTESNTMTFSLKNLLELLIQ